MEIKTVNFHNNSEFGMTILDVNTDLPFIVKRIYYLHNTTAGASRGYHSHKNLQQCLICLSGSVKVLLDDGHDKQTVLLDDPEIGLCVGPNLWHEMHDFSDNSILMVLADDYYKEEDYIREYDKFLQHINEGY